MRILVDGEFHSSRTPNQKDTNGKSTLRERRSFYEKERRRRMRKSSNETNRAAQTRHMKNRLTRNALLKQRYEIIWPADACHIILEHEWELADEDVVCN
ncbi:hypothetical protein RvY_10843 [Ramazzottius varieornatus]|uniref:Uncharacterized protein n=1 Tax=Ramazzottius varieornatus TaxID=947166 RepID=A0A1D1VN28_RAMVA|nr:hypothetical protein RvY_10843 [Ramazzottius varieornatus]